MSKQLEDVLHEIGFGSEMTVTYDEAKTQLNNYYADKMLEMIGEGGEAYWDEEKDELVYAVPVAELRAKVDKLRGTNHGG